jgi:hypothetical protein
MDASAGGISPSSPPRTLGAYSSATAGRAAACVRITGAPTKNSVEAVKRTPDAITRELAGLIKQGNDLRRDSLELGRTAKELLRRAARLKGILAKQKAALNRQPWRRSIGSVPQWFLEVSDGA